MIDSNYNSDKELDLIRLFEGIRYFSDSSIKSFFCENNIDEQTVNLLQSSLEAIYSRGLVPAIGDWCRPRGIKFPKDEDKDLKPIDLLVKYTYMFDNSSDVIYEYIKQKDSNFAKSYVELATAGILDNVLDNL